MSNQPKICPTCHTPNPGSAQFCAACGTSLQTTTASSMMQKYPELKLQPTTLYPWQSNYKSNYSFLLALELIFLLNPICVIVITHEIFIFGINNFYHYPDGRTYLIIFGISLLIAIIFHFIVKRSKGKLDNFNKNIKPTLQTIADYIQAYKYGGTKKHPNYVFFVKDSKFGVMNVTEFKVAIPAQYDEIAWREPNRILTVTKGSETYDIDIFGNQLR